MKTRAILFGAVLFTAAFFSSCKKSAEKPAAPVQHTPFMKFTVNGTTANFNQCTALGSGNPAVTAIAGINSFNGAPGDSSITVYIVHDIKTLKEGQVFQAATSGTLTQADRMVLFYAPDPFSVFATAPGKAIGSVTITGVTAKIISGTFSGKVYALGDINGADLKYAITNGSFTAKIVK